MKIGHKIQKKEPFLTKKISQSEDLFEMDFDNMGDLQSLLSNSLFQEIEQELSQKLFNNESESDFTDGPLDFTENLVKNQVVNFVSFLLFEKYNDSYPTKSLCFFVQNI